GTYTYTVTDAQGCSASTTITINQPSAPLSASSTHVDVLCKGDHTGSITVSASGGSAGYTGSTTYSGLGAGTYTYTVTDTHGCSASTTTTITEPSAPLSVSSTQVNVLCKGDHTGSVTVSASGGTAGYTGSMTYGNPALGTGLG